MLSKKRRFMESEEKENQNGRTDDHAKQMKITTDDRSKIRNQIIEEFQKRSLEIPFQMIGKNFDGHCSHYNLYLFFAS
jgi:hypothetical protein